MICIKKENHAFTLIELMVSMLLSLILVAAVAIIYLSSSKTNRTNISFINAQNDGQMALNFIKDDLARTGWTNNNASDFTLAGPFTSDVGTLDGGDAADILKVHYESCDNSVADNDCKVSGLDSVDCNGVAFAGGDIITNTYQITNSNELTCNNQVLISNVESFQVLYGQLNDQGLEYVTANNIADSSKIHSVQFGLMVRSDQDTADTSITRAMSLLDRTITVNDKKLRLKFESTVMIVNKPLQ